MDKNVYSYKLQHRKWHWYTVYTEHPEFVFAKYANEDKYLTGST